MNSLVANIGSSILSNYHFAPFGAPKTSNFTLHFPINAIDLRVYTLEVNIRKAFHLKATNDIITLKSLHLTIDNETSNFTDIFQIRHSNVDNIKFSTADFFTVESFETKSSINSYFTIIFAVEPEKNKTQVDMGVEFTLTSSKTKFQVLPVSLAKNPNYRILNALVNSKAFIYSGFIHSGPSRTLPKYIIKLNFKSYDLQTFQENDFQINQIIVNHGIVMSINKSSLFKLNHNKMDATFEDISTNETIVKLHSSIFEIIYEVILVNPNKQVEIGIEQFELKRIENPSSNVAYPVIATVNSNTDPFDCPANFQTIANKTYRICIANKNVTNFFLLNRSCLLKSIYRNTNIACSSKCSNIFSFSFFQSTQYSSTSSSNSSPIRYIPYQPDLNELRYLKVSIQQNLKTNENFCITFRYKSTKYPLVVSTTAQSTNIEQKVEFPVGTKEEIICTKKLTATKYVFFRFNEAPIDDTDGHWLEILKTEKTNISKSHF